MNEKIDWKRKLTSRKLWSSVASFVCSLLIFFGYAENTAVQVAALIMAGGSVVAYIIGEGLADSKATTSTNKYYFEAQPAEKIEEESAEDSEA